MISELLHEYAEAANEHTDVGRFAVWRDVSLVGFLRGRLFARVRLPTCVNREGRPRQNECIVKTVG